MGRSRISLVGALLASACFHPRFNHTMCGPGGECPDGLTCSAQQFCEDPQIPVLDAAASPIDAFAFDASSSPIDAFAFDASSPIDANLCPAQCTSCADATRTCNIDCRLNGGA